jgi:type 1 glutamine amidotransferase
MKRALILLGGMWHDFDGFSNSMRPVLETAGWQAESTYDLERLTGLERENFDLVLSYTCFSKHGEGLDNSGPEKMSDAQIDSLTGWVRQGGALLAAHSATVLGHSSPALGALLGGSFVEHPPAFAFTVFPVYGAHPITAGIEAFTVYDEMYIERYDPRVDIHMLTVDRGTAYPLVWSKAEGEGRVAHIALGHSAAVWQLEPYQRLMLQAAAWLAGETTDTFAGEEK